MVPRRLLIGTAALAVAVWVVNLVASMTVPGYDSDPAINGVLMAVVGGSLALLHDPDRVGAAGRWVATRADVLVRYLHRSDVTWLTAHGWKPPDDMADDRRPEA